MYQIDLLKGQGLPVKTKPQHVVIIVMAFAVPIIAAIFMVTGYAKNKVVISILNQNIKTVEQQIQKYDYALKYTEAYENEKAAINACIADVSASIGRHIQWSPILVVLVENLPDSVVLTSLDIKQYSVKRKVPAKDNPEKMIDVSVPARTLKMRVSGSPNYDCDSEVKQFRERMKASKVIGPKLEDIVIASQGRDTLDGYDVVTYDIECIFKPHI